MSSCLLSPFSSPFARAVQPPRHRIALCTTSTSPANNYHNNGHNMTGAGAGNSEGVERPGLLSRIRHGQLGIPAVPASRYFRNFRTEGADLPVIERVHGFLYCIMHAAPSPLDAQVLKSKVETASLYTVRYSGPPGSDAIDIPKQISFIRIFLKSMNKTLPSRAFGILINNRALSELLSFYSVYRTDPPFTFE